MIRIIIGFVLSFIIGAGCRYFDIPAASPPVIPGVLIVLAMTLGYSSMDRVLVRNNRTVTDHRTRSETAQAIIANERARSGQPPSGGV